MRNFVLFSSIILFIFACAYDQTPSTNVDDYITTVQQDTLQFQLALYIAKKPKRKDPKKFYDENFHSYYQQRGKDYEFLHYWIDNEHVHHFSLLKKEYKSLHNKHRAIAGRFTLNDQNSIENFDYYYWSPAIQPEDARKVANDVFDEILKEKSVKKLYGRKDLIDFPNKDTFYDAPQRKWVYQPDTLKQLFQ
ncbi:hypothetical protein [Sediminitomix flava]|uniref:Uncharacterized protein n=1 Tax=Sediminitomix flava TaxID=379075 RepID=A0A315ZF34_SEDFL|nr:hypothetical protein [Sediminitomix flava]PWJ44196.1 hypothetical protein BC781_101546 [Sediminitomix flava]